MQASVTAGNSFSAHDECGQSAFAALATGRAWILNIKRAALWLSGERSARN